MTIIWLGFYLIGCVVAMLFFLLGSAPRLSIENWPWPVIFLWPMLVFWPAYALARFFLKWKVRHHKITTKL